MAFNPSLWAKFLATLGILHPLKIYSLDLIRRDRKSALGAGRIE
jgi:hypothetical protein